MTNKELTPQVVEQLLWEVVKDYAEKGPGYAQESVVLREVDRRMRKIDSPAMTLELQQHLLTCWHDLFISPERKLSWGYNVDNPNSPWFHLVNSELMNAGT